CQLRPRRPALSRHKTRRRPAAILAVARGFNAGLFLPMASSTMGAEEPSMTRGVRVFAVSTMVVALAGSMIAQGRRGRGGQQNQQNKENQQQGRGDWQAAREQLQKDSTDARMLQADIKAARDAKDKATVDRDTDKLKTLQKKIQQDRDNIKQLQQKAGRGR